MVLGSWIGLKFCETLEDPCIFVDNSHQLNNSPQNVNMMEHGTVLERYSKLHIIITHRSLEKCTMYTLFVENVIYNFS